MTEFNNYHGWENSIQQTSDGNIIVVGSSEEYANDGVFDMHCFKISYETVFVDDVSIGITGDNLHVLQTNPTIAWSYHSDNQLNQEEFEVEVGIDNDWDTAEMWDSGIITDANSSISYSGVSLTRGETYYLRIRLKDGLY